MAKRNNGITLSKIIITAVCVLLSLILLFYGCWRTMFVLYPGDYDLQSLSYVETAIVDSEYVNLNTSKWPYLFVLEDGTKLYIPSRMIEHFDYESFEKTVHGRVCIYYDTNNTKSIEYNGSSTEAYRAISITENDIVWVSETDNEKVNSTDYRLGELGGYIAIALLMLFVPLILWLKPTAQNPKRKRRN